ncbi:MAG: leucine-rich repeat protein, partial [Verrucomicrobiota bacterium]
VAIAAGNEHTMALRADGSIVCWGRNLEGQTSTSGLSPITASATLPGAITTSVNIPAGPASTVTLAAANAAIVPGMMVTGGAPGTIGDGATIVSKDIDGVTLTLSVPNTNAAALTGVTLTFAAQANNTITLAAANPAIVPGMYVNGPVSTVGTGAMVLSKAADNVTLTLSTRNAYTGTTTSAAQTLSFSAGIKATAIVAGGDTSYVLKPDATVAAWGDDANGQTHVPVGLSGVTTIAAGGDHAMVLKSNGTVQTWGKIWNGSGYINEPIPANLTGVTAIAAGASHGLAVGAPPLITTQPVSLAVNRGSTAIFTVTATSSVQVSYQWRKDGSILSNGGSISGAATATLNVTNVQATDVGAYSVVVSNVFDTVTSTTASLSLKIPVVTTGPTFGIGSSAATLLGTVNPNGAASTAWFEYGSSLSYGGTAPVTLSPANGSLVQDIGADISGLQEGTTYHYRLAASNSNGTSYGDSMTFLTAGTSPFTYTIANGAVSITAFNGSGTVVSIPDSINGLPVISINDYAFYQCTGLTSVIIPYGVTSIGIGAFYNCPALRSVTMPGSVTSIGDYAFASCVSLAGITIPGSVISIGSYAFSFCSALTSVVIPDSVTSIGSDVFSYCTSLTGVTLPSGMTSISDGLFYACGHLTDVTLPASVITIGSEAFYYCASLTAITIPDGVIDIGNYAFYYCNGLTNITIPACVISIGSYAFYHCVSLTGATITDGVANIGVWAFGSCTGLTHVTIPASVATIGSWAFSGCGNLAVLKFQGDAPSLGSYGFYNDSRLTVYYMWGTTGWTSTFGGRPTMMLGLPIAPEELASPKFGISGGNVTFSVQTSVVGRRYQLQYSDTMESGSWPHLGPLRVGDGSRLDISTPFSQALPRRFYRLALDPTAP